MENGVRFRSSCLPRSSYLQGFFADCGHVATEYVGGQKPTDIGGLARPIARPKFLDATYQLDSGVDETVRQTIAFERFAC
jgi:hypothetical protein